MTAQTLEHPNTTTAEAVPTVPVQATVPLDLLTARLKRSVWALPTRTPHPVMAGIMIRVTEGAVFLGSYDYDVSCSTRLPADTRGEGVRLVPGLKLRDTLKPLDPKLPVTISFDGEHVLLTQGRTQAKIPTLPDEQYPSLPQVRPEAVVFSLPVSTLTTIATRAATSSGDNDTIRWLAGAKFEVSDQTLTVASTDRYRLTVTELPVTAAVDAEASAVIKAKTVLEVAKLFAKTDTITMQIDANGDSTDLAVFTADDTVITTTLMSVEYIDWRGLFSSDTTAEFTVDATQACQAINIASTMAERGTPVSIDFADTTATFTGGNDDDGSIAHQIDAKPGDGAADWDSTVAFNHRFLLEGCKLFGNSPVNMSLVTKTKPVTLTSPDLPGFRYLLLPVRVM